MPGAPHPRWRHNKGATIMPAAGRSPPSSSASPGGWLPPNPVELVKREAGLQSNRLPVELREAVEGAVEALGGRVTAGDVAARAGVKLRDATDALQALAYDTQASLKVRPGRAVLLGVWLLGAVPRVYAAHTTDVGSLVQQAVEWVMPTTIAGAVSPPRSIEEHLGFLCWPHILLVCQYSASARL